MARLRTRAPNLGHRVHYADLTRISEMKRVATEIAEGEPRIDVLINNAGAMFATRKFRNGPMARAVGQTIAVRLGLVHGTACGEQPRFAFHRLRQPENSDLRLIRGYSRRLCRSERAGIGCKFVGGVQSTRCLQ